MHTRQPPQTRSATKRATAKKSQAISEKAEHVENNHFNPDSSKAAAIAQMSLPEELCALLYIDEQRICIRYADIERYFESFSHTDLVSEDSTTTQTIKLTSASDMMEPKTEKPDLFINLVVSTPKEMSSSINMLSYIKLYLTVRHVRLHFMTPLNSQGRILTELVSNVIFKHANYWRHFIVESNQVAGVRVWWIGKFMDIVLKTGCEWAIDWDCHSEGREVIALKNALGVDGNDSGKWRSSVVVASVENRNM